MVPNSGKTQCVDAYKPVNLPEPIQVEESTVGEPVAVRIPTPAARASPPVLKATLRQAVSTIDDRWRIDDEWWRSEPVSRLYYAVLLASGQRLVIYQDLAAGGWYKQVY